MLLRSIHFFRELVRSHLFSSGDSPTLPAELTKELEDLRKVSLNLLMTFLTVHAISASNALGATMLALLVYTINLHIVVNTNFLQNSPILSKFHHTVPLGIFCMAIFKLVIVVQSPAIAAAVLLVCISPSFMTAVYLARRYAGMTLMSLPVQKRDVSPAVPSSPGYADVTAVSGQSRLG